MTQEFLQDAVCEDLKRLFDGYRLVNGEGEEQEIRIFTQDLPIRRGADEDGDPDEKPEPYVIVRTPGGAVSGIDEPMNVDLILLICVCDPDPNRKGHRDCLRITKRILWFYNRHRITARRYEMLYPIQWTTNQEDTHPYYFAAISLKFEAQTIYAEEQDL